MKRFILISSICFFIVTILLASTEDPVAVLFQVKGKVEYSKNGSKWKKVRRNKYLFDGYQIRSAEDGSGRITNRKSGKELWLKPNTMLKVTSSGVQKQTGELVERGRSSQLLTSLIRKFSRSQSYTTVRRSARSDDGEMAIVRHLVLTDQYPDLVWENIDPQVEYKLYIGNDEYSVPKSKKDVIRVRIQPFESIKEVFIEAIKENQISTELKPYQYRGYPKKHTVQWMAKDDQVKFEQAIQTINGDYPENSFLLGSFFEREEMWVAAMDQYQKYLAENPDDIEMTPYLFRVYKKLKLQKVYNRELRLWTQAMKE